MSLGLERDDVWGEDESQEQGTSDTIDAASASSFSQRFLGEASSSAIGSLPPAAKKTKRASKWQEDWKNYNMKQSKGGCFICTLQSFSVAMISPLPLVVYMK